MKNALYEEIDRLRARRGESCKHEIIFPCGCVITIFQFDAEQPRIEKEPCKQHKGVKK